MRLLDAYTKLLTLNQVFLRTQDAAACLAVSNGHASQLLKRMQKTGLIQHVQHNLWGFRETIDLWELPEYLTHPYPSYISLQSALYYHGMISQIPSVLYVASVAKTKRYETSLGVVSVHHVAADLFCGFDYLRENSIKIAVPEKALFDCFYLSATKTQLFANLPELELPPQFNIKKMRQWTKNITSNRLKTIMEKKIAAIR